MSVEPKISSSWTREDVAVLYNKPLLELVAEAARVHLHFHNPNEIQVCSLMSVKTGGCSEDCGYCAQSSRATPRLKVDPLADREQIISAAKSAKEAGATRFCMGASGRNVRDNEEFERILSIISEISRMGLEVCCTLGMLAVEQAEQLRAAGLTSYNHNLDTSERYYPEIVTSHTYQERIATLNALRAAKLSVCCGGIIGMGESHDDRIDLLHRLCTLSPHPDSVPINRLVPIPGTALEHLPVLDPLEVVRMIATARILMPKTLVRLAAGRKDMPIETQALCFIAGANSIFSGQRLLTTDNATPDEDQELFDRLGLKPRVPNKYQP